MEYARGFVALAAPWLAQPGDAALRVATVVVVLVLIVAGAVAIGYGGVVAIRELIAPHREVTP
jgi:hypothetical protein